MTGAELSPPANEQALNRESVLKKLNDARGLVSGHRLDEATALVERLRDQAVKEDKQALEGAILNNLGLLYERQSKYLEAQHAYDRSISVLAQTEGETTPDLIPTMDNFSNLLYESGQFARAEKLLLREIAIMNANGKPDRRTANALAVLGKVYLSEQKLPQAEETSKYSLKVFSRIGEPENPGAALCYSTLGAVLTQNGAMSAAEEPLQHVLSMVQKTLAPGDKRVGEAMANLGLLYAAEGSIRKAEPLLEKAYRNLEETGTNSLFRRGVILHYAEVERKLGHGKKAKALAREAEVLAAQSPQSTMSRYVVDASGYLQ